MVQCRIIMASSAMSRAEGEDSGGGYHVSMSYFHLVQNIFESLLRFLL